MRQVDHLLMGGQACVLYGAAEFSRDLDLALLPDPANLKRLREALDDLEAAVIAVPPFLPEHLAEGLAVHFPGRSTRAASANTAPGSLRCSRTQVESTASKLPAANGGALPSPRTHVPGRPARAAICRAAVDRSRPT